MPTWLLNWLLPLAMPLLTQLVTEGIKRLVELIVPKLPGSAVVALAGVIGEVANQAQSMMSGVALPPGFNSLVAVAINELKNDLANSVHPTGI